MLGTDGVKAIQDIAPILKKFTIYLGEGIYIYVCVYVLV